MLWVYTITDSNLRMGIMESFLSFLKSLGYEAHIQDIYYQKSIYIDDAQSSNSFKPGDVIYFIVDSDVGWASFNNNFRCAVWDRVDKSQYHEWCKQRINRECEKTMKFKNLNVGDVFKLTNGTFLYIKIAPMINGYCRWEAVILTGDKKGCITTFTPETSVEIFRDLNDVPAECFKDKSSFKELINKYKDNFMTYGEVHMDAVTYAKADCENTWRLYKEMGNTIKKVIFNDPATIVIWGDGSKTVVKAQKGEKYDKEKGLALCYMKKMLGNQGNFNNVFREWIKPEPTGFYDTKHPELGIQDLPPKNKKVLPSGRYRIKTAELRIIDCYLIEHKLTYKQIAIGTGLSTKTIKRALCGKPMSSYTKFCLANYFAFPIGFTRYAED